MVVSIFMNILEHRILCYVNVYDWSGLCTTGCTNRAQCSTDTRIINSPSKLQILAAELEVILLIKFNKIKEAQKAINNLLNRSDISFEQKNRLELINKIYKNNE